MVKTPLWEKLWALFEERLFPVPSGPDLFNQYRDTDPEYDLPNANLIRRENLKNYLMCYKKRPPVLLVGEAAGPWGCRFSGIPFTSESQLVQGGLPFKGRRSGRHDPPYRERSGAVLWGALLPEFPRFFLWNAVPLHPHEAEGKDKKQKPFTIRAPRLREIKAFCPLLKELWSVLDPSQVVAVGRKAQSALDLLEVPCDYVRHPAQAGATEFRAGIKKIFEHISKAYP